MEKIFIFEQSLMNGTVTMETQVAAFASRELAEQVREDIRRYNAQCDLGGMRVHYGKVKEIEVCESKDEVPFYRLGVVRINEKK